MTVARRYLAGPEKNDNPAAPDSDNALHHSLLQLRERGPVLDEGTGRRGHGEAHRRPGPYRQARPTGPRRPPRADEEGEDAAQGSRAIPAHRRTVCRDEGADPGLLRDRLRHGRRSRRDRAGARARESRWRLRGSPPDLLSGWRAARAERGLREDFQEGQSP